MLSGVPLVQSVSTMSIGVLILLATLLFIRNGMGLLIVLASALFAGTLVMFVPPGFTGHVVIALGLALLVGAGRAWINLVSLHFSRRELLETSDAYLLFRRTMIPSPVWLLLFGAVIGYSWFSAYGSFGHLITRAFG
ncbi:M50 family metallopeptidase [Arthrobacter sp.]|uniref:M50 family metallopeptidase n=1 Tax=Arthrobacter sp. TaxID=1667 RepID=UPI0033963ACB